MAIAFENSTFYNIIEKKAGNDIPLAILGGVTGSRFLPSTLLASTPFVVFDFETTGLSSKTCRIIEIGAIRYENRKEVARLSSLINPEVPINAEITKVTGLTDEDLKNAPLIKTVLPQLHDLMRGAVGVAHNAEFDVGFLIEESARLGVMCSYHILCTLKMARALVKCERKNLDALATHYELSFVERHRSIGDIMVTAEVLWHMLDENRNLKTLADVEHFRQEMV